MFALLPVRKAERSRFDRLLITWLDVITTARGHDMPDETLDIVNKTNEVIGQGLRSAIHQAGHWHRGVHLFLVTPDSQLILQRRSAQTDTFPNAWDCSSSEHVQVGESSLAAVRRGLQEELGITSPLALKPVVLFRMDYGPTDNMICTLFQAEVAQMPTCFDAQEVAALTSHSLGEVQAMLANGEVAFTRWFEHMLRWTMGQPSDLIILKAYD